MQAEREVILTARGLRKIEEELDQLRTVHRKRVADRIRESMHFGEMGENSEFEDAKNEQAFVEGRILTLEKMVQNAVIIEERHSSRVELGSKVSVVTADGKEEHYTIVGSAEASPKDGRISNESPVGRALLGKSVGEEVQVQVPAGVLRLTITAID